MSFPSRFASTACCNPFCFVVPVKTADTLLFWVRDGTAPRSELVCMKYQLSFTTVASRIDTRK